MPGAAGADPNTTTDKAAACIIGRDQARATNLASALPGSQREDGLIAEAMPLLSACMGQESAAEAPRFTRILGRVAELLYARKYTVLSIRQHLSPDQQDRLGLAERGLDWYKDWPPPVGTVVCAANRDLKLTEALIHTMRGSVKEERALAAFVALLPPCLPTGQALRVTPEQLRSIAARARLSDNFRDDRRAPTAAR